jgi:hypothetical protein
MAQQQKIFEELQTIETFAQMLLEKCYSVRQLLSPGDVHPRASVKKKSQSKINQVIANRNKSMIKKAKKLFVVFLLFVSGLSAQTFSLPSYDSLCSEIDSYYDELAEAETKEFQQSNKLRWMNYVPSPGYSPFTGGFSFSLNISGPLQEIKLRRQSALKVQSIKKLFQLQATALKNEVFADYEALKNSIIEYHSRDSLEYFTQEAFNLFCAQYDRHEMTPSDFISKKIAMENFIAQRIAEANKIYQSIFAILIKCKKPVHPHAPAN